MPQLFRYSIEALAFAVLRQTINQGELNEHDLRAIMNLLAEIDASDGMVRALVGERALAIDLIRAGLPLDHSTDLPLLRQIGAEAEIDDFVRSFVHGTGFFERDLRFFLTAMETNTALAQLSPPASLRAASLMRAQSRVAVRRIELFSMLELQRLERLPLRDAEHRAQIRLARTALAVELFRKLHQGKQPARLDQLVPLYLSAIPNDPFDGKPLRYRCEAAGYCVYSVGVNGVDDHGIEKRRGGPRGVHDVVLRIRR